MRWGMLGKFACVALVLVSGVGDFELLGVLACAGYICSFVCYMIGSYLFSKLCGSSVFVLNCVRFFMLIIFVALLWLVAESFVDDMFGVIVLCLLCAGFSVVFLLLERRVVREMWRRTAVGYFRLGFYARAGSVALFAGFCLVVGFGVGAGVDVQSFSAGVVDSGLVWVYWAWWLVWFVLLCVSFLLYILAYWRIERAALHLESSECCANGHGGGHGSGRGGCCGTR